MLFETGRDAPLPSIELPTGTGLAHNVDAGSCSRTSFRSMSGWAMSHAARPGEGGPSSARHVERAPSASGNQALDQAIENPKLVVIDHPLFDQDRPDGPILPAIQPGPKAQVNSPVWIRWFLTPTRPNRKLRLASSPTIRSALAADCVLDG